MYLSVAPKPVLSSTMFSPGGKFENSLRQCHNISPIDRSDTMWDGAIDSSDAPFLTGWVKDLGLTQADRPILSDGEYLTASHMSAATNFLSRTGL